MSATYNSLELVDRVEKDIISRAHKLKGQGVDIHLAAIVLGPDSRFVEMKQRRGRALGIETSIYRLPTNARLEDITGVIGFLNVDPAVHGILIQLPLPDHLTVEQVDQIINSISPDKDVDGLGPGRDPKPNKSLDDLVRDTHLRHHFLPTTAWSMLALAEHHELTLENVVIVGHGRLVGMPLQLLLKQLGIRHRVVDLNTPNGPQIIADADVILAGTDVTEPIFDRASVKKDAAIIAAGDEINRADLENWAGGLSPAKGGVGPLTITLLLLQTVLAAEFSHDR